MRYVLEHKFTIFIITIFIVVMFAMFSLLGVFLGDSESGIYGNRLKSVENVQITNSKKRKIMDSVSSVNKSKSVVVDVKGKIINVIIVCNDDVTLDDAKGLSGKIVEVLSDKEKSLYDVQMFVKKNVEDSKFPIIGYRHRGRDYFSYNCDKE